MKRTANQKYSSVKEIHELIDRVGKFLIDPATKRSLETRSYSAQKYDNLDKIAIALEMLRERKNYAKSQGASFEKQNQIKLDSKKMFAVIKSELIEHINHSTVGLKQESSTIQRDAESKQAELADLQQTNLKHLELLGDVDANTSISLVKEELEKKEKVYTDYEEKRTALKQYANELRNKMNDESNSRTIGEEFSNIQKLIDEIESLNQELEKLKRNWHPW